MHEKLEKLLAKLEAEREELRGRLQHGTEEIHQEWAAMETRWLALQERLRVAGLGLAEKAGGLIESFEEELQELKQEVTQATWKLNLKVKDELHDLGEDVDKLQHKIADKVEDVRLEVMEELHELGEEMLALYQKFRSRF